MKEYQYLIGRILLAAAIVIASIVIADAMKYVGDCALSAWDNLAMLIREGLL